MWDVDKILRRIAWAFVPMLVLLFAACGKGVQPVLGELVVDSVAHDAVYCHVDVIEGIPLDYAFCYATTKAAAEKLTALKVLGIYRESVISGTISGLTPNTTYYIRVYAMNVHGRTNTTTIPVKTLARIPTVGDNLPPTMTDN